MKVSSFILLLFTLLYSSCSSSTQEITSNENTGTSSTIQQFDSDDELLNFIQEAHFRYAWHGAEENSGLSPERIHLDGEYPQDDKTVITTGGSGFGIASIIVGMDRGFITRAEGVSRMKKIVDFLEQADRFHGVWPHWIEGTTGKVKPFGTKDNGGDLVESAFLMQGLLAMRQYLNGDVPSEKYVIDKINTLWHEMKWTWYQKGGENVLYWHWSPNYTWDMNFPLRGYNECLIAYILAASSPTHPISPEVYYEGWARSGAIASDQEAYGIPLEVKHNHSQGNGGPLFWAHYSYIGLNPKGLKDRYTNYWEATKNQALINHAYCADNPKGYANYSDSCWGLTASYTPSGYGAQAPDRAHDNGTITPTAALSSFPYTPEESMKALKYFYSKGNLLLGEYGFFDAFNESGSWYPKRYLAIDQNTINPMIENHRTGLIWKLFMSAPEIQKGLDRLDFEYQLN